MSYNYYFGANLVEAALPSYFVYKYSESITLTVLTFVPLAFFGMLAADGYVKGNGSYRKGYLHEYLTNKETW